MCCGYLLTVVHLRVEKYPGFIERVSYKRRIFRLFSFAFFDVNLVNFQRQSDYNGGQTAFISYPNQFSCSCNIEKRIGREVKKKTAQWKWVKNC